jgi:hypothetical protein
MLELTVQRRLRKLLEQKGCKIIWDSIAKYEFFEPMLINGERTLALLGSFEGTRIDMVAKRKRTEYLFEVKRDLNNPKSIIKQCVRYAINLNGPVHLVVGNDIEAERMKQFQSKIDGLPIILLNLGEIKETKLE